MTRAGGGSGAAGGWTLLLTQTDGNGNFDGSVVPFRQNVNVDHPSISAPYARDWSDTGAGVLPASNDEFMIVRQSTGDFVTMQVGQWCAGTDWEDTGVGACGGSGHPGYARGHVWNADGSSRGDMNFNGCSHGGNCACGGGDGVACLLYTSDAADE